MTRGDVDRLLARAREARWSFPSSSGNPARTGDAWVEQAASERASFVEAAQFLIEHGDEEAAVELAANVWRLWMVPRDLAGGRAFLAAVLGGSVGRPSRARALASYGDGLFAFWEGAHEESRARNEAALAAARAVGDAEALALAHLGLARVALLDGDYDRVRSLAVRARELASTVGPALGQAPLHLHAQSTRLAGDYDAAAALFAESLALNRRLDDPSMVGVELHNLGHVEIHRGNVDDAERHFAELEALGLAADPYGAALTQLNRAAVAFGRGDRHRAEGLVGRAQAILDETGTELAPDDRFELDWLGAQLAVQQALERPLERAAGRGRQSSAMATALAEVSREQLHRLIGSGEAFVLVDALSPTSYAASHLPGAINIPPEWVDERARRWIPDRSTRVVVYCSGPTCESSVEVAERLIELGYRDVGHYAEGKSGWRDAGLPLEGGRV